MSVLFPPSKLPTGASGTYLANCDGSEPYLRPCGSWAARLSVDEWLELRVLKKSIRIDPRSLAAAYRSCFNNPPRRRATTAYVTTLTCQQLVLRAAQKYGTVGASDVNRRLGKVQRSLFSVADITTAMRELVDSGQAEWADEQEKSICTIPISALTLAEIGNCVYSFRELQLALTDLGHKGEILRHAERWDWQDWG